MIYLDNAATTKMDERVLEAMLPYMKEEFGNTGSRHSLGFAAKKAVDNAREQVADFIGANPEQIIFTSGGSEANNLFAKVMRNNYCIMSHAEHSSLDRSVYHYSSPFFVDVDGGCVKPVSVRIAFGKFIDASAWYPPCVSVMYVNNEIGSVSDVQRIGEVCQEFGVMFHTDCVQAASCMPLNVDDIHCDFMSLSSHKIHGPKGVGALFVRSPSNPNIKPLIYGGHTQEQGLRGGTENVAGIVGFGKACELTKAYLASGEAERQKRQIENLVSGIKANMKELGVADELLPTVNGTPSCGKIVSLCFPNIDGETLILTLDSMGVCVSAGSACNSYETKPSRVLHSIGLSDEDAMSSIRLSVSRMTTDDEIENAASIIACAAHLLN